MITAASRNGEKAIFAFAVLCFMDVLAAKIEWFQIVPKINR